MAIAYSQGAAVTFNGVAYGNLVGITSSSATTDTHEWVPAGAPLRNCGTLGHSAVVSRFVGDTTPGTLSLDVIGAVSIDDSILKTVGNLVVSHPNNAISYTKSAICTDYEITLAVGDVVRVRIDFQLLATTGAN